MVSGIKVMNKAFLSQQEKFLLALDAFYVMIGRNIYTRIIKYRI